MVHELFQEGNSLALAELAVSDVLVESAKTTGGETNTSNLLAIAPRAIRAGSHSVPDVFESTMRRTGNAADAAARATTAVDAKATSKNL